MNFNFDLNYAQKKSRHIVSLSGAIIWGLGFSAKEMFKLYTDNASFNLLVGVSFFIFESLMMYVWLFFSISYYHKLCNAYSKK